MTKSKVKHPEWSNNASVYEVNLRQYSGSGSIREFEEHLLRIAGLGVDILWFMPLHPIGEKNRKGTMGSYYSAKDFRAIDPLYGTPEDFRRLVDRIHNLGMRVIIDWVANHTAWDHRWTLEHPEFYALNESGGFRPPFPEWEDVIQLNYNHPALWEEMITCLEFWLREMDIDGFRCDMAHLVPTHFWNLARLRLEKIKPVFMLAESESPELLEYAFDAVYNWKIFHAMNDMAAGKITDTDLSRIITEEVKALPDNASHLLFTSNHDENSWNGSSVERLGNLNPLFAVLTFMIPGIPLVYSGQEAANTKRIKFFDKDEIGWKDDPMAGLYKSMNALKKEYRFLLCNRCGDFTVRAIPEGGNAMILLERRSERESLLALFNLSTKGERIHLPGERDYKDAISGKTVIRQDGKVELSAFGYRILTGKI